MTDMRDSVMGAGVDFVGSSTSQVLQALFPVKDMLAGQGGGA